MEERRTVRDLACRLSLKYLFFPLYRPPETKEQKKKSVIIIANLRKFFSDFLLTDRSTLTTREAKLIFDA